MGLITNPLFGFFVIVKMIILISLKRLFVSTIKKKIENDECTKTDPTPLSFFTCRCCFREDRNPLCYYKNLSYNEEFFQGHFPGLPIMPGVLIIEVLAQTAAIMGEPEEGSIYMIVGVEKFKFQQQVVPGDQIICTANLIKRKLNLFFVDGTLKVKKPDGTEKICASGTIKCAKVYKESQK